MDKMVKTIFAPINNLYTFNYSCAKILNLFKNKYQNTVVTSNELYRDDSSANVTKRRLREKLYHVANIRNYAISEFNKLLNEQHDNLKSTEDLLAQRKETLLLMCNIWFEKNYTFEQYFDNFKCIDPELNKLLDDTISGETIIVTDKALAYIASAYGDYIEVLQGYMLTNAFETIIKELIADYDHNGDKTQKTGTLNSNTTMISKKHLDALLKKAKIYEDIINTEAGRLEKQAVKLKRQVKNMPGEEVDKKVIEIYKNVSKYEFYYSYLEALLIMINALLERHEAANSKIEYKSPMVTFVNGLLDLVSGINIFDKNDVVVNEVYVTDLEINYMSNILNYLKEKLGAQYEAYSQKQK